jgi:hypothetical protein
MSITKGMVVGTEGSSVRFTTGLKGRTIKTEGVVTGIFNFSVARNLTDILALNQMATTPSDTPETDWYFGVMSPTGIMEIFSCAWVADYVGVISTSTVALKVVGITVAELTDLLRYGTSKGYSIEVVDI